MSLTIRDTIHSYIDFTPLETLIIDTKLLQRLRHIKQNAFSFYTYPTCQTTRFEHSLGVMKIGNTIIESLLKNSNKGILNEFLYDLKEALRHLENSHIHTKNNTTDLKKDLVDGVRLACLLHDVGHFPFSHLIETIFKQSLQLKFLPETNPYLADSAFVKEWRLVDTSRFSLKLHELTTYLLVKNSLEIKQIVNTEARYKRILNIALLILNPQSELLNKLKNNKKQYYRIESVIKPLRMILDSEMDADRFDYLTRDSVNSSVTSGDFDIDRILSTIVLYKLKRERLFYYICPSVKGLSAVESFYIERIKAYNWFIYHHNSVFFNRLCTFILLKLMDQKSILYKINNYKCVILPMQIFHYSNFDKEIPINDVFLFDRFYWLYERTLRVLENLGAKVKKTELQKGDRIFLNSLKKKFRTSKSEAEDDIKRIKTYFEILLFRKRKKLSLWKNISEYKEVDHLFLTKFQQYLNSINTNKIEGYAQKKVDAKSFIKHKKFVLNAITDKYLGWDNLYLLQTFFLERIKHNLNNEGVIFIDTVNFDPIGMESDEESKLKLYCPVADGLIAANKLSPLLDSLRQYKEDRIKLFAFLILIDKDKSLNRDTIDRIRKIAKKRFVDSLLFWLVNRCKQFKKDLETAM